MAQHNHREGRGERSADGMSPARQPCAGRKARSLLVAVRTALAEPGGVPSPSRPRAVPAFGNRFELPGTLKAPAITRWFPAPGVSVGMISAHTSHHHQAPGKP